MEIGWQILCYYQIYIVWKCSSFLYLYLFIRCLVQTFVHLCVVFYINKLFTCLDMLTYILHRATQEHHMNGNDFLLEKEKVDSELAKVLPKSKTVVSSLWLMMVIHLIWMLFTSVIDIVFALFFLISLKLWLLAAKCCANLCHLLPKVHAIYCVCQA